MDSPLLPKEAGKFISENSKDVSILEIGVQTVAEMLFEKRNSKELDATGWKLLHDLNPQTMSEASVNWVFVTDTLNFSFWSENDDHKCLVKYKGRMHSGYWSLCAAINRALDEGIPITSASYFATITLGQLKYVLRSDTDVPMPLIEERLKVLKEAGNILLERFDGSFLNCIKKSENSAQKLLRLVVENFPSYRDEATFQGKKVAFYKRAQILIADIWGLLEGKEDGAFHDMTSLTMFADYRIPQALVYLGAMKYSEKLMQKLKQGTLFRSGDCQEVEIRGCSIWCIELILHRILELQAQRGCTNTHINSVLIDYYLWDYARDHRKDMADIPIHRVRCIYY
ncbi:queuosine salvage protein isoform X1 [Scyliorhinus canicula]|uniref:queuosine salvage protein isoform X1 n=2 Tax=Scyliorhinus canicula TaxID=7830 RepID=UPI0018F70567|nr:queuosine salvage protein isoform X1 [Scyliorhinus canicula]XP_038660801.1 queuosine salvage protein isoform X1 [Scyliorhinus canicula]XP_038660802.1 queuosine salvage protein isoform X1 [Scyliorhinus canicula]XP_038660803.1 queuosine salvage protein isoform X1 [Scyliorhinus canicula]